MDAWVQAIGTIRCLGRGALLNTAPLVDILMIYMLMCSELLLQHFLIARITSHGPVSVTWISRSSHG